MLTVRLVALLSPEDREEEFPSLLYVYAGAVCVASYGFAVMDDGRYGAEKTGQSQLLDLPGYHFYDETLGGLRKQIIDFYLDMLTADLFDIHYTVDIGSI